MSQARHILLTAAVMLAVLVVPAAAGGQQVTFYGGTGAGPATQTQIPVRVTGGLFVTFHGDPGAGCASRGVCGYAGSASWRAPAGGTLQIAGYGAPGHRRYEMSLMLGGEVPPFQPGGVTTAAVQLAGDPAAACVDAQSAGSLLPLPIVHGSVVFSLHHAPLGLMTTRCAGPRDAAALGGLPARALSVNAVRRGRVTINLSAARTFRASGFAGSVRSTLVIRLGRPGPTSRVRTGVSRRREVIVTYRADVSGTVVEHIGGDPAGCGPLGACGVTGTATIRPAAHGVTARLGASGPRAASYRQLLAAVGLVRGRPPRGTLATGAVPLGRRQTVLADITQGPATCHGASALGGGAILLIATRGLLTASLLPPGFAGGVASTGCPGPLGSSLGPIAAGSVPLRRLGRRTVTLSLTRAVTFDDYGYRVSVVPHLTLTLRRVRVRRTVVTAQGVL